MTRRFLIVFYRIQRLCFFIHAQFGLENRQEEAQSESSPGDC